MRLGIVKDIVVVGLKGFGKFCSSIKALNVLGLPRETEVGITSLRGRQYTPSKVEAKTFFEFRPIEGTNPFTAPPLTEFQFVPLSVERYTPLSVPAKT